MSEIRHIVFDIGRVLLHYDPELPYTRLIPEAQKRHWFLGNICTPEWNIEQDRGRGWNEAEALLIAEHPEHEDNIRAFRGRWHEMVPHAYEDVVEIMEGLIVGGHDVTMLTNFASDTFAEARERFAFLKKPRGVTVSGEVRLLKPQREIYDHHVSSFGLDPAATLFIDDSEKNVDGAKAAGWQALHFRDAATLASDLARLGVAV
ncbi:MAG: HAD family phosphatase [Nitratireductor sp.]|nr:HAD family phosphatase [Nitratireductor sp.]